MSAGLIWLIIVVAVVAIAVGVGLPFLAARNPAGRRHPRAERRRTQIQGGTHQGGGRSVMPRRDEEVVPDEDPEKPTVPVRKPGNGPLDL